MILQKLATSALQYKEHDMSIAKEYLKQQMDNSVFQQSFLNEKIRLDIEYQLEELKRDIAGYKPVNKSMIFFCARDI